MQAKANRLALLGRGWNSVPGSWSRRLILGITGSCLGWSGVAQAEVHFTPVAVQGIPAPDGGYFYPDFGQYPAIDGTNVVFSANRGLFKPPNLGSHGVYRWDGRSYFTIADANTPMPGSPATSVIGRYESLAISGTEVAFSMTYGSNGEHVGVFATYNGELKVLATETTPILNFTGTPVIPGVSRSGDNVAFTVGQWDARYRSQGVYLSKAGGSPAVVADTNTTVPGTTGKFTNFFGAVGVSGENVAFIGQASRTAGGVYLSEAGQLSVVADASTKFPNGACFLNYSGAVMHEGLSLDGKNVAFGDDYVRASIDGQYQSILGVRGERSPSPFAYLDQTMAIDDKTVVFGVRYSGGNGVGLELEGIYMWRDGLISKVVDINDTLDGKHPTYLRFGPDCISGDNIVFYARFADQDQGIYMATVPEPGVVACLLIAAVPLMLARKRLRISKCG